MLYGDGMILETVKSGGISHNSYFLGSGGEAAVIDPRRDVDVYLDLAEGHGMNIRYIFETHRNEDYTIGSVELARYVDAEILHGSALDFRYGTAVWMVTPLKSGPWNWRSLKLQAIHMRASQWL